MTVLITLTAAGVDLGPFDLYSDTDSYTTAFASGITRSQLLAGYTSTVVPASTSIIKLVSTGVCTNELNINVSTTTTTTTAAPTTTTTTTAAALISYLGPTNINATSALEACANFVIVHAWSIPYRDGGDPSLKIGDRLYIDGSLTTVASPQNSGTLTWVALTWNTGTQQPEQTVQIDANGYIITKGDNCYYPPACTEYTVSTSNSVSQQYSYTTCAGTVINTSIGGAGGYEQDTFCAQTGSVSTTGDIVTVEGSECS